MFRKICLALIALAGLSSAVPAQTFNLPEIGIQTSGPCRQLAVRNQNSKAMVPLGCLNPTTGVFDGAAQLPDFTMSSLGVLPDTGVDVSAAIVAAAAKLPATGARLKLACGLYLLSSTAIITNSYLHIQGGGQNCTRLRSTAGFATGDVLKLTGSYSGISDVAFEHVATDTNSVRTSGYTLNLANGYSFARNISMRNCFVCIRMGAQGGWSSVDHVMLQYMADGVINPGSGGILVENDSIGPANWINHAIIMSNFIDGIASNRRYPTFAVKLTNTGETVISDSDFISNRTNLLIQPGAGQTVQATRLNSTFLDSAQADNFAIVPTASGYVFDVDATGSWITNTSQIASAINTNGFRLDASGNTTLPPGIDTGIRGVRWNGGVIASTTGKTGVGVLCADATPQDVTVRGTTISGWHIGVDIAPGCSH
ncbi:hypothetical protein ASF41_22895 [Methylobacterium sp. Leaf111]|uniref:hypothetical protein n=1 Tax=Methylobacterium sp. Leaf111 TaxID=1736257 RepID=UPI0006FAADFD|nr:hypothetical protein [Methylobacterium sp. Leaf111]KQP61120.1 hypothetical protein ASF41_22895 [Methylobacterium sp. Leaf111]